MSLVADINARIQTAIDRNDAEALDRLLKELYQQGGEAERPYDAAIELKPEYRDELAQEGFESDAALNWANRIARSKRLVDYRLKTLGGFKGPRIVSEGDSWFQYPLLLNDMIDIFIAQDDMATYSLGAAGDLVEHMAVRREYIRAISASGARVMLLSGGGNDLLGDGRLFNLLRPYQPGASAEDLLDRAALEAVSAEILGYYNRILVDVGLNHPGVMIFGHGYDTPFPRKGKKHFGKPLEKAGIPLPVGRDVIAMIVAYFRERLVALADRMPNYSFIDLTGTVGEHPNSWFDELHPHDSGFAKATAPLLDAVRDHLDGPANPVFEARSLDSGATPGPVRIVLDPGHGGTANVDGSSWNNAFGPSGSLEKNWTLDVARRAERVLAGRGFGAVLTRSGDTNLTGQSRRNIARAIEAEVFVSIHFNASSGHNAQGTETYIHSKAASPRSIRLMRNVQSAMVGSLGLTDRNRTRTHDGVLRGPFGVIRESGHAHATAACLLEVSFMDRLDEEKRIQTDSYRDRIATALADGIQAFLAGDTGLESNVLAAVEEPGDHEDAIAAQAALRHHTVTQFLGFAETGGIPDAMPLSDDLDSRGTGHVDGSDLVASPPTETTQTGFLEGLTRDIARRSKADMSGHDPDAHEDRFLDFTQALDLSGFGRDPERDRNLLARAFGNADSHGFESAGFDLQGFSGFMDGLGLRYFSAAELLYLGSSHQGGSCAGRNSLPPRALWNNLAATARMLDEIRHRLGCPVRILSGYRSSAYNGCVGGESGSLHLRYNALDWTAAEGDVATWHRIATEVRAQHPDFIGGIGRYDAKRFIHIDTRGAQADW